MEEPKKVAVKAIQFIVYKRGFHVSLGEAVGSFGFQGSGFEVSMSNCPQRLNCLCCGRASKPLNAHPWHPEALAQKPPKS